MDGFTEVLESIITLLVGSAVFITGMNMMSSGLKKATGKGLKNMLRKIQNSRLAGLGIGAAVTALIQSSAATSVMAIGFISAGVMTVFQGTAIILGACIGTTITGVLASLSSFGISSYFSLLAFVGIVLLFFKNDKVKHIGEILCGLGLLFFGLETMKGAFGTGSAVYNFCSELFATINNPILLVLIGALFTALVQSSSATSGIVIVMVDAGTLTLGSGFFLILGATIGTVITTLIACIGGNADVKRTGFIALCFKVICAFIATLIIWPFQDQLADLFLLCFQTPGFSIAMFNVIYSTIFFAAQLPFINLYVKLANLVIKEKPDTKLTGSVKFIDDRLLNTPSVAMMQVKREIINMMNLAYGNFNLGYQRLMTQNTDKDQEIEDTETQIDYINGAITNYLIKLSPSVEAADEKKVGSYFHVINDIERIGDHAHNFLEMSQKMVEDDVKFSSVAKKEFQQMYDIIQEMCNLSITIFHDQSTTDLAKLHDLENQTDNLKTSLSDAHYSRISKNECKIELSPFYTTLVSELERIADHIVNIGYSVVNPTGDDENDDDGE